MFYHASNINNLMTLKPHMSMHGKSMVYFSNKRENVLVYLSNAVEKYIREKYNRSLNNYKKWATYGFTKDGRIRLEEYYPNALEETYKGVKGYIYEVNTLDLPSTITNINNVFTIDHNVDVSGVEVIDDAYLEIVKAENQGLIEIERFENLSDKKREIIENMILSEYVNTENQDYKEFLYEKFVYMRQLFEEIKTH